jgi:hypothetical protein
VRAAFRRFPLERALQASIFATIVGAMLASSSVESWTAPGRALRMLGLACFAVTAAVYALASGAPRLRIVHWLAAVLVGLALVSAAWSVNGRESIVDGVGFAAMVGGSALVGLGAAGRPDRVARIIGAVVAAIGTVAAAGLVLLVVDPAQAIGEATRVDPATYSGIGGNPNTASMLFALGLPLTLGLALRTQRRTPRIALFGLAALLVVSIFASGSRGAIAGAFVGAVAWVLVVERDPRLKLLAACAVVGVFALGTALSEVPSPDPQAEVGYTPPEVEARTGAGYYNADAWRRLEDDIGHPPFGEAAPPERPGLIGSSGRLEAWAWAVDSGGERPLLGFGFGQEDKGFTDRLASFEADVPENAYLGFFLQLGLVGLGLFVAVVAALAFASPRLVALDRVLAASCAGAVLAGLVLAVVQSYVSSPGAVASATLWISMFSLAALVDVAP